MKNSKGFNLISVIIIICITSITSAITAGIIVTNNYGLSYNKLVEDKDLNDFLKAYSNIVDNYYEDIDKEKMLDTALDAMLNYLGDNYTTYLNDEQRKDLESRLSGTYEGIGIQIESGAVAKVIKNSPAEEAGIAVGDKFLKIDGKDATNYSDKDIVVLIRNSNKEKVTLVMDRDGQELTFEVKLGTLTDASISYNMVTDSDIGYIKIDIFSRTLTKQMEDALEELNQNGMKRLIIDLRDNSGGYLDVATSTASLFLEKGKLIYSLQDKDKKEDYYDETENKTDYPIVILLNHNSASASEILAAALKDSYGAIFVGETSYGKGKVQQTYELEDGSLAKYTSAKWLRPNGSCIDGVGLKPDYAVDNTYNKDEQGNEISEIDNQYNKAIEIISTM